MVQNRKVIGTVIMAAVSTAILLFGRIHRTAGVQGISRLHGHFVEEP